MQDTQLVPSCVFGGDNIWVLASGGLGGGGNTCPFPVARHTVGSVVFCVIGGRGGGERRLRLYMGAGHLEGEGGTLVHLQLQDTQLVPFCAISGRQYMGLATRGRHCRLSESSPHREMRHLDGEASRRTALLGCLTGYVQTSALIFP
ncbi:hypothetical protein BaRGS_00002071 [Batillaria attramentaria]|uniref:Uncharacterized protein n=1 Tax=Batillaria attramentaria TaxID=370345 RepID=A0ABD0M5F7_9CAEN